MGRPGGAQRLFSVPGRQWLRADPHAELVALQPGLEVRHEDVDQIFSGVVELAEVHAPGDVAEKVDSRCPQAFRHWILLGSADMARCSPALAGYGTILSCRPNHGRDPRNGGRPPDSRATR